MVTAGTYRKDLNLLEERDDLVGDVYFSAEQKARERKGKEDREQEELDRFFKQEEKRLERVNPTLERCITPLVKKALVELLVAANDRIKLKR